MYDGYYQYDINKTNFSGNTTNLINSYRQFLFNYYKNKNLSLLKIQKFKGFDYKSNFSIKSTPMNTINKSNILYGNKELPDIELYQKFGTYKTKKDNNGKTIFYTDDNHYKGKENVEVIDFQNNINGFPNIGNSCYMNSFLQILLHTPNFLKNIYQYKNFDSDTLIYNLKWLSKYPYNKQYLKAIKTIMGEVNSKYKTYSPGDSQSFAIDFIDQLICECKGEVSNDGSVISRNNIIKSKLKGYESFCAEYHNKKDKIERLFQFTEVAKKTASTGNYNFSINLNIELSFPPNCTNPIDIYTLLDSKYSKKNNITDNKPKLADVPEILIISIVRGIEGRGVIKTKVAFKKDLKLGSYLDTELTKNLNYKPEYTLYAVNERYGEYKSQGHYVCFIKILDHQIWYRFSDLWVKPEDPDFCSSDVFGLYYIRNDLIKKNK